MNKRQILGLPVALIFLFAFILMGAEMATASVGETHQMSAGASGDCPQQPMKQHGKSPAATCCVVGCVAPALSSDASATPISGNELGAVAGADDLFVAYIGEVATPPPRTV